jgi:hypothetical protein
VRYSPVVPSSETDRRAPNATPEKETWVTTTDDDASSELELDRLAWNLPAPRDVDPDAERPWPPWPFGPLLDPAVSDNELERVETAREAL